MFDKGSHRLEGMAFNGEKVLFDGCCQFAVFCLQCFTNDFLGIPGVLYKYRAKGIGENGMSRQEGESSGVGQTSPLGYLGFCVLFANHLDSRDGRMVSCEEEHSWG